MPWRATAAALWLGFAVLVSAQTPFTYVPPGIQSQRLLRQDRPRYPELAKQARIAGTVRLLALIDETGTVEQLKLIDGHPLLVEAAIDAVRRWRYRPMLQDGVPVAVVTTIKIPFTINWHNPDRQAPIVRVRAGSL